MASIKIFVELDDDLRFIRRLTRDINERGRSVESVIQQYLTTVKPMYHKYVKPQKNIVILLFQMIKVMMLQLMLSFVK